MRRPKRDTPKVDPAYEQAVDAMNRDLARQLDLIAADLRAGRRRLYPGETFDFTLEAKLYAGGERIR